MDAIYLAFPDKTEEVRRLGVGRLFEDMLNKMQHKIEHPEKDPLKILVHSTHDTAIAAIRQTLDVFDDRWVSFNHPALIHFPSRLINMRM